MYAKLTEVRQGTNNEIQINSRGWCAGHWGVWQPQGGVGGWADCGVGGGALVDGMYEWYRCERSNGHRRNRQSSNNER